MQKYKAKLQVQKLASKMLVNQKGVVRQQHFRDLAGLHFPHVHEILLKFEYQERYSLFVIPMKLHFFRISFCSLGKVCFVYPIYVLVTTAQQQQQHSNNNNTATTTAVTLFNFSVHVFFLRNYALK